MICLPILKALSSFITRCSVRLRLVYRRCSKPLFCFQELEARMAFSSARNSDRKRLPENLSLFKKTQFTNDLFVLSDFPVEMKPGNVGFFEPYYTRDVGLAFH
jgi:hypothetical protein